MAHTREWRITPLAWYTLWEYKLYFVNLGKWYAKIFLKKGKTAKTPYLTFEANSKIELIQKIDDHCLKTFGRIFRYKKLANQDSVKKETKTENLKKKTECSSSSSNSNTDEVNDNAQKVTDSLLKFFVDIVIDMDHLKRLATINVMLSALAVVMIILLNIIK